MERTRNPVSLISIAFCTVASCMSHYNLKEGYLSFKNLTEDAVEIYVDSAFVVDVEPQEIKTCKVAINHHLHFVLHSPSGTRYFWPIYENYALDTTVLHPFRIEAKVKDFVIFNRTLLISVSAPYTMDDTIRIYTSN